MDSMSEGLMSLILSRMIPSTTISALLFDPVMVAPPRRVISGSAPGCPVVLMTRKPVTELCKACPQYNWTTVVFITRKPFTELCKACPALLIAAFFNTWSSILEMAVVKAARFCEPP